MNQNFNPQTEALKAALRKLFSQDQSFSICTIDACLKLTGEEIDPQVYETMRAVHCVNYTDMSPDFRAWLFIQTLLIFHRFEINEFEVINERNANLYLHGK